MNHAEWERKVKDLEGRVKGLKGFEKLGPSQLKYVEGIIRRLDEFLKVRM